MLEENVSRTYFLGLASISATNLVQYRNNFSENNGSIVPTVINVFIELLYTQCLSQLLFRMKKDKNIIKVVALAIIIRSGFYYLPVINQLSSGFAMTISALTSAFIGAVLFNKGEAHG